MLSAPARVRGGMTSAASAEAALLGNTASTGAPTSWPACFARRISGVAVFLALRRLGRVTYYLLHRFAPLARLALDLLDGLAFGAHCGFGFLGHLAFGGSGFAGSRDRHSLFFAFDDRRVVWRRPRSKFRQGSISRGCGRAQAITE